jgi:Carboxypeptidase regulatory-like domain
MTLSTKPRHEEDKKLSDKVLVRRLNIDAVILIVLTSCIGVVIAIIVPLMLGFTLPSTVVTPTPTTDLGSVAGFVMSSDGLPIGSASVIIYKHMGLIDSADKNADYIEYALTESDGSYSFDDLPSGVYRLTVTYPDEVVQIIDNYAVWPGSSSSFVFAAE